MMKNTQRQAMMYIGLGVLITIVVLFALGRLRTELYQEGSDEELLELLGELEEDTGEKSAVVGPSSEDMDMDSDED
jgi:Tfp pilus assembly protein PilN